MKPPKTIPAALGSPSEKPRTVEVGGRYGDLEVLEEVPRTRPGPRRYLVKCLREVDGRECGKEFVTPSWKILQNSSTRACADCAEVTKRAHRARWGKDVVRYR